MSDRKRKPEDGMPDEDRRLFEHEMRDVRPVARGRARVRSDVRPAPSVARPPAKRAADALHVEIAGEHVSAFDPGVSPEVRRALRRGDTRPEGVLDMHGLRAAEARRRLESFLLEARSVGWRCVLLVTGRGLRSGPGGPVLRGEVVDFLTQAPFSRSVLGLVSAPTSLGGSGALLVLLRKIWKEKA
jgi:DNA-nicking Smr family endonuclease